MPELPDVEIFKRYVARTSLNKRVESVTVRNAKILGKVSTKALGATVKGRRFRAVRRHGKYLFINLDNSKWLTMHFGMSGSLHYFKSVDEAPEFDRLIFTFSDGYHLGYYSVRLLGRVDLVDNATQFIMSKNLDEDALDPKLTSKTFEELLSSAKGTVKSFLMDQTVIGGIGNIYSDEILFQARLHPKRKVSGLDRNTMDRIYGKMRGVLMKAIECGADSDRLPRSYLIPHRQKGDHCPRCGGPITQIKIGGRSSYICTQCQGMHE